MGLPYQFSFTCFLTMTTLVGRYSYASIYTTIFPSWSSSDTPLWRIYSIHYSNICAMIVLSYPWVLPWLHNWGLFACSTAPHYEEFHLSLVLPSGGHALLADGLARPPGSRTRLTHFLLCTSKMLALDVHVVYGKSYGPTLANVLAHHTTWFPLHLSFLVVP